MKEKQQARASEADVQHEKLSFRAAKLMTQAKITSIYGDKAIKSNNIFHKKLNSESSRSMECIDVENDEEEKRHVSTWRPKRRHAEFASPICEIVKSPSPSSNEDANNDISSNSFVTAKTKLVFVFCPRAILIVIIEYFYSLNYMIAYFVYTM